MYFIITKKMQKSTEGSKVGQIVSTGGGSAGGGGGGGGDGGSGGGDS